MAQVISATNFINSKINDGEWPTPSVLNRPLLACIDADNRLEEAVKYMARSTDMIVTTKSKFLSHCIGDGIDAIGTVAPDISTSTSDAFVYDGVFKGSAFTQPATTNVLGGIGGLDTTLKTLNGWYTLAGPGVRVIVGANGTTFTNTRGNLASVGETLVTSPAFAVTVGRRLSYSVEATTESNLSYIGMRIGTQLVYVDSTGTRVDDEASVVTSNKFKGLITIEDSVVPAGAVKAFVVLHMWCDAQTAIGSVTFKNAMLAVSPVVQVHCPSARSATSVSYPRVVVDSKVGTVVGWAKFNPKWMVLHVGPIGPLFLVDASGSFDIGAVHDSVDGTSFKLKLRMMRNGITTYGNSVTLDASNLNTYVPFALRFSEYLDASVVRMKIEFAIVDASLTVHKSTIDMATFTIPSPLDICVGSDLYTTDYFNGPVSEIRYDTEWINDYELTVIALSKRAFMTEEDLEGTTLAEVKDYLDGVNANLIRNPDGRLNLNHWQTYTNTTLAGPTLPNPMGLTVTHVDPVVGAGFVWAGTSATNLRYVSPNIDVVANEQLVYRAKMYSAAGSTGSAGIAIGFYNASGVLTIGPATEVDIGSEVQYYEVLATTPADAVQAVAVMYINSGSSSTRIVWGKMKMERGSESTLWLDDTTPKYAVYAP